MKKILLFALLITSIEGLAQFPTTQSMANASTKLLVNGGLEAKRGIINGVFTDTTTANSDHIDFYNGAQIYTRSDRNFWLRDSVLNMWIRMAKYSDVGSSGANIYNTSAILESNRTLTGLNNTYSLSFDSLNSFRLQRNGITRFNMNSSTTQMISPNQSGDVGTNNGNAWIIFGANAVRNLGDSTTSTKLIAYETNINGSLTTNALVTKSYVDSVATGGSGTINSGATGKPAYYVGATTLDDFAAIDYATSGTNMLLTTQNTTDIGLNIKGVSSQSANLQNWSSSAGTGDLGNISASGYAQFVRGGFGAAPSSHVLYVTKATGSDDLARVESSSGNAIFNIKAAGEAWLKLTASATNWYVISGNRSGSSGVDFSVTDNGGTDYLVIDGNDHTLRLAETTSSTPASGFATVYPKSDGLFYGKDDAGVETRLSNQIFSKGMTLESPGAAESFGMWQTQVAITVSSIKAVVIGSSPSVTINIAFGTDRTSGTNVFSAGTAITNTTTGQTINSGFNDATIPAGSFIWFVSTAQSGTVTQIEVTINYTED